MALMYRLFPPADIGRQTLTANGRVYTAAPGGFVDAPAFSDAVILMANGWVLANAVSTTAGRPKATAQGSLDGSSVGPAFDLLDLTLGYVVTVDASGVWRNPATGAAV